MINYDNPLTNEELSVSTMAEAAYTLKLCNENYFGAYYQGQEMMKELNRLYAEIEEQKQKLLEPYQPKEGETVGLPIPSNVIAAIKYLDEQKSTFSDIFHADFEENVAELNETRRRLESKVTKWFLKQRGAFWLAGGSIKLSGCTMRYSGGNVSFSYEDYDDE